MAIKKKIQFIFTDYRTFVEQDFRILSEQHTVKRYMFVMSKNPFIFFIQFILQFFNLVITGWNYDIFYIWFADYFSLLPTLFAKFTGKKCIIVIGGYDVCRISSIKYGAFYKKYRGFFSIQSIKNCTLNLTVSNYVDRKIRFIAPKAKRHLIYNCIDFNELSDYSPNKDNSIITVGNIHDEQTFFRKGIDTFIDVARANPQFKFRIIGIDKNGLSHLLTNTPQNLTLNGRTNHEDLVRYYQNAKIYCQFSRMDTFCLTLAEAMYFNCIPVITNEGGMPEVIGDQGYIVPRKIDQISKTILSLMNSSTGNNQKEQIINNFDYKIREKALIYEILKLFK